MNNNGHKIGYARVSTVGQDLETQRELLLKEGCEKLFVEKVTGTSTSPRKKLADLLDYVREGDTVYVTKIDRLARSIIDLNKIVSGLIKSGVNIAFLKENIEFKAGNANSSINTLLFNVLGSFAQFERDLIVERTTEGRERAKAAGKHMGRPASSSDKEMQKAIKLHRNRDDNGMSVADICRLTGVKRATLYAKLKAEATSDV
ncbi:DNA invertase Pin-like site-specific DNA recombinase [Virgibacillus halotolerans]|uniref:recombinase family protein n=1 Tax=Virgibacillus halotolerans TaxID=1071053 RepID=UPI00196065F3|nr:recombinase family protein [Virgibacillus halotolerans]MBM7598015.1 DNA invertase Pin-like site-specific DNA recombinase [Virgibacillus halotolerans]